MANMEKDPYLEPDNNQWAAVKKQKAQKITEKEKKRLLGIDDVSDKEWNELKKEQAEEDRRSKTPNPAKLLGFPEDPKPNNPAKLLGFPEDPKPKTKAKPKAKLRSSPSSSSSETITV